MAAATPGSAGPIRVVIAGVPGLLASIVHDTLTAEEDIVVVAQVAAANDLAAILAQPVDVVVTTASIGRMPPAMRGVLFGDTPVPVVAISADGRRMDVFSHAMVHDRGLRGLTDLVREAVAEARSGIGG
jgi:hypothetical protein